MKLKTLIYLTLLASLASVSYADMSDTSFKKLKQEGALVYYTGSVTLEGEFWYPISASEQEMIGDQVCFDVAEQDGKKIPRDSDDSRSPWFCFKDTQQAVEQFGLTDFAKLKVCELRGKATIEVSNYVVDREETETHDVAELVKLVGKPETVTLKLLAEGGEPCQ